MNVIKMPVSMLVNFLIELFWLPARLIRHGFRGVSLAIAGFKAQTNIDRWRYGLAPERRINGGEYSNSLPSGRPIKLLVHLVGGRLRLALVEAQLDGRSLGTFYFSPPGMKAPHEFVAINNLAIRPGSELLESCTKAVNAPDDCATLRTMVTIIMGRLR